MKSHARNKLDLIRPKISMQGLWQGRYDLPAGDFPAGGDDAGQGQELPFRK